VSNILTLGCTILGTSNFANPFRYAYKIGRRLQFKDVSDDCMRALAERRIDALICIGGDGTMASAAEFARKGLTIMGVPKTIDNDLWGTDVTFGFDTAVTTATEAIDKIHTTASSHHRVMIVEVMGRYAGWIALRAGVAGGGDVILLPEIPFDIRKVCAFLKRRMDRGKRFSIIVVAEGAKPAGGEMVVQRTVAGSTDPVRLGGIGLRVADDVEKISGVESRVVVLGHLQRGGSPTPFDRWLGTRFGVLAVDLLMQERFGRMVSLRGQDIVSVDLKDAVSRLRRVDPKGEEIRAARSVGTSFGDE